MDTNDPIPTTDTLPASDGRGRSLRATILAAGAALGMTLAGLGIASAQTEGVTPKAPSAAEAPEVAKAREARQGEKAAHHRGHDFVDLTIAAKAIGITEEELRKELRDGKSIAQVAEAKGVSADTVIDALVGDAKAHLAEHVAAGRMTQAEADRIEANLEERVTAMVNHTREGREERKERRPGAHLKANLAVAAKALGMTEVEVRTALASGQSLAQLAESKGVPVATVIAALVDHAKTNLAAKVAAGELTQAEADAKAATIELRINEMVQRTLPERAARPARPAVHQRGEGTPA